MRKLKYYVVVLLFSVFVLSMTENRVKSDEVKYLTEEQINYLSTDDFVRVYESLKIQEVEKRNSTFEELNQIVADKLIVASKVNQSQRGYLGTPFSLKEIQLIAMYPVEAAYVNGAANNATNMTFKRYGRNIADDSSDAFRHAYWNAKTVLDLNYLGYNLNKAKERTKVWTDAHESDTSNQSAKSMDLYNNGVGRNAVDKNRSDNDMANIIYNKVNQGEMRIIKPTVWRIYLWQNGGQHLYTKDQEEYKYLVRIGSGRGEGIAWHYENSGDNVYRMYNPAVRYHFYTKSVNERDTLRTRGWNYEGVGFRSNGGYPIYRLCNPNTGKHLFTTNLNEKNVVQSNGWRYEGVAFYASLIN